MNFDPREMPQIVDWLAAASRGGRSSLSDYVSMKVGLPGTVAVAGLLWPKLIRVDDCILVADRYSESSYAEFRSKLADRGDIEATINHVHLWDTFIDDADDVEALEYVGHLMAKTWLTTAREAFPEEDMVTEYSNDPVLDYGPTVTLHVRR
jgi:hypothetical protein